MKKEHCACKKNNRKKDITSHHLKNIQIVETEVFSNISFHKNNQKIFWKIHISSSYNNFQEILNIVSRYCVKNEINFKFIRKYEHFIDSLINQNINNLTGKFITIYPKNVENTKKIIKDLYILLKKYKGPITYSDRQYKNSIIHYRYGKIINFDDNLDVEIIKKYKKDEIKDIFPKGKLGESSILKEINPIGIIQRNAHGSIYITNRESKYYILKETKRYMGNESLDPIKYRKNEIKNIEKLKNNIFFPKIFDHFFYKNSFYILEEFKQGKTLKFLTGELSLLDGNFDKNKIEKIKILIDQMEKILQFCYQRKFILNDIHTQNFIFNEKNNELYFIDLEMSFFYGKQKNLIHSPYEFRNRHNNESNYNTDKYKMGMMLLDILFDIKPLIHKQKNNIKVKKFINYFIHKNDFNKDIINIIKKIENVFSFNFLEAEYKREKISVPKFSIPKNTSNIEEEIWEKIIVHNNITNSEFKKYMNKDGISNVEKSFINIIYILLNYENKNLEKQMNKWFKKFKEKYMQFNKNMVLILVDKKYFSPYLKNGLAGLLYIFYLFTKITNSDKYLFIMNEIYENLKNTLTRKVGLCFGYTGIIYVLNLCKFILGKDKNKEDLIQFLNIFTIKNEIFDYDGSIIDNSFSNGFSGIQYILSLMKK